MSKSSCFHCGLPIIESKPPLLDVEGHQQPFCCHGCKSVCDAIIASGNIDYYKHRDTNARTFNAKALPELLDKLKLYDNEKIQREFVRSNKNNTWKEAWLILEEIRCAACMWLNERTLRGLEGVLDVQMDYTGQQARIRWDPAKVQLSDILSAITSIGYVAHPFDPTQRESLNKEQKQRSLQRIIFALIMGMAVMQSSIGSYFFGDANAQGEFPLWITISRWVNVASTFLILAYPGQLFYRSAWRDIKNKTLGMDVPVVIGLSIAWLGSLYNTLRGVGDVYFESIAMFVILLLIARYIELKSRIESTALLDRSAKIIPQTVKKYTDHDLHDVAVIELSAGDKIQISPGETLPVDAHLLSTSSSFDESLLTGESLPVTHLRGELLLGGSINIAQVIDVEVATTKAGSTFSEIQQLAQRSTNYRPYYVDIAEKVAGKFVATILFIAMATFLFWSWKAGFNDFSKALSHSISVLIVTCPCALALAAPVALSLGASGLNRFNILAVKMSSIEKMSHVDALVFDKTGTLTTGKPCVANMVSFGLNNEEECLNIAASMEHGSHHPFAYAILEKHKQFVAEASKSRKVLTTTNVVDLFKSTNFTTLDETKQILGQGIEAKIDSVVWRLGSDLFIEALLNSDSSTLAAEQSNLIDDWREQGNTVLYLASEEGLQMVFFIEDPLRAGISNFLHFAKQSGIHQYIILSGDHQQSVDAIASKLGVTEAYGGLSPQQKLAWVRQYQQKNQHRNSAKLLMLGDGINDAPTLAAADISLSFTDATDLAKHNSDFIILAKDYTKLGSAFQLMRDTRNVILQNLVWALIYNAIAIPLAVIGWITPWMAAIGMSLSSLFVVFNSMRLKK